MRYGRDESAGKRADLGFDMILCSCCDIFDTLCIHPLRCHVVQVPEVAHRPLLRISLWLAVIEVRNGFLCMHSSPHFVFPMCSVAKGGSVCSERQFLEVYPMLPSAVRPKTGPTAQTTWDTPLHSCASRVAGFVMSMPPSTARMPCSVARSPPASMPQQHTACPRRD